MHDAGLYVCIAALAASPGERDSNERDQSSMSLSSRRLNQLSWLAGLVDSGYSSRLVDTKRSEVLVQVPTRNQKTFRPHAAVGVSLDDNIAFRRPIVLEFEFQHWPAS